MIHPILIIVFNFIGSCLTAETASFFGGSYISVPLEEAKSTTNIQFRLLTKNPDTLLFLAAGKTDYCLIKLVSGRLREGYNWCEPVSGLYFKVANVHLNLGAGESTITSPVGLRLDDLTWHYVAISRIGASVNLTIDNIHVTREKLPGHFLELNIHYGLYIGGQGEFSELFLGHVNWFRGCISGLTYNGVSPLARARHRLGSSSAHDVSWSCAAEFFAGSDKEISFADLGSFLALPNTLPRVGAKWVFMIKTASVDCLLMYTSGVGENADFVGAEIINSRIHVILDKGGGPGDVVSEVFVSDGEWHSVDIAFNSYSIELTVDNKTVVQKLIQTTTRYYDLGDLVYVGGIEVNKRVRALGQGLKAADTSFKGCMKSIQFGTTFVGFPDARVSKGLLSGCIWSYPCSQSPCLPGATCAHRGLSSFMCFCESSQQSSTNDCTRSDFSSNLDELSQTLKLELIELTPVSLYEGQNTLITPSNINVILDYAKYGIRENGVIFSTVLAHPPKYGRLAVEVWEKKDEIQRFTLLDLLKNKVRYVHDGSESREDVLRLEVELQPAPGQALPGYLQATHPFLLSVNITEINDPPILLINSNKTLILPQGTRKLLDSSVLNASDEDSPRGSLVYTILFDGNGRLEKIQNRGTPITHFTQEEVDKNMIVYYHGGPPYINSKLTFQVSDGFSSSPAATMLVSVIPLVIKLINNTGAILPFNTHVLLNESNIKIYTNADDPLLHIVFKIIENCDYGVLETKIADKGASSWQSTTEFSYSQLMESSVRYRHVSGRPAKDRLKFVITTEDLEFPSVYEMKLSFIELNITERKCERLNLMGNTECFITEETLLYETTPLTTSPENIIYTLRKLPVFGNVFLHSSNINRLVLGDIFTQDDIINQRVKYKMLRTGYVPFNDSISFHVSVEHSATQLSNVILISYFPSDSLPHTLSISVNTLKVMEGGITPILPTELSINVPSIKSLVYEISFGPLHGSLLLVDSIQNITESNVLRFTPSQISAGRLFYSHDGSETSHDIIQFFAVSNIEDDFMTVGSLEVNISLINDNAPKRTVSNVFRIVKGGQRVLTTKHIKFEDEDIDFDAVNLVYTVKKGNGVYSSVNRSPLLHFTQGELESGKVLIIESGHDESPIFFSISDGRHVTETSLDVRPSPPFVEITNNSHLIVSQGGQATVTSSNLFSDTNIDIDLKEISYNILSWPAHGELLISGLGNVSVFNQGDIELGNVVYKHSSTSVAQDRIQFRVLVGSIQTQGSLAVRVFPLSYWEPLVVVSNETLIVEEFTSIVISQNYLQVKQEGVPPSDITYLVVSGPEAGYLDLEGSEEDRLTDYEERGGIKAFDQATLNSAKLYYVQTLPNQTKDTILIDVTNGVVWLRSLQIQLRIAPSIFHLGGEEISVVEGGSVILPLAFFSTSTPYYENRITDYYLAEEPAYGHIVISPSNKGVSKWSAHQIKGSTIKYIHDGSETLQDSFSIVARSGKKESEPSKIIVKIIPINDMSPVIVNKTCLKLWKGGSSVLTPQHLAAIDEDTPPGNITFVIISASGGHIARTKNKSLSLDKFTQEQVNDQEILVVHDGSENIFVLETVIVDGKNKYGPITFTTEVDKPLMKIRNLGLHMFPRLVKHITSDNLNVSCPDFREVYYEIRKSPSYGKLIFDGHSENLFNFTQSDINNLKLSYQHTMPFKNASLDDSFMFDVYADFVEPVRKNVFEINISVLFGGLEQVFEASFVQLSVEEGHFAPFQINTSGILDILINNIGIPDPILKGVVSSLPGHGLLSLPQERNLTVFSDSQLQSGHIRYEHDHSDTLSDFFQISLYLEPSDVLLNNISFEVKISPVNDQPFKLLTKHPSINVVHGQEVVISRNILMTEDSDTQPAHITYEIVDGPSIGSIYHGNVTTYVFTQLDINNNKIKYRHFGPLKSTHFNFKVSDGRFEPEFGKFNITISEIQLNMSVRLPILIQQGNNHTSVSPDILDINTNARTEDIIFNVTTAPLFGKIYLRDSQSFSFSFPELVYGQVFYLQTDMSTSNDTFEMIAFNVLNDHLVVPLRVNVSVVPLIKIGHFSPSTGSKTRLDLSVLDASPLAKATRSNPTYKIIKKPKHGRLKKIIRTTGEHKIIREKDISKFTHKEIQSNVIYFVAKKTLEMVDDKVTFLVISSPFQPGLGELKFKIQGESPPTTSKPPKVRLPGSKVLAEEDGVRIASPNMSDDYLLGLSMVAGVIALALLIVGFVSCGSKQANYENSFKSDLPDSLPRPPEELSSSSPQVGGRVAPQPNRNSSIKLPHKIPNNSLTSSELELNLRYPYGDEDWSTFTATDDGSDKNKHNPLLRKNQYWV